MKQGVKGAGKFILVAAALLAVATVTSAQFARKARVKKTEAPALGTFYSLTLDQPPFPFNPFPDLPVYALTNGAYVYDDRSVDYAALRAEQSASLASARSLSLPEGGGGMMMLMGGGGNTNLALSIPVLSGGVVTMSLLNAKTNESHDIFSTTTVGTTNAWLYRGRLAAGQAEVSLGAGGSTSTAFTAANSADSDGDTVPDGVETFSTQTDPNTPDSPGDFPPGHPMVALLTEAVPDVRVKHVTDNLTGISYYSFGTAEGYFGTNLWTRGVGGGAAFFEVLQLYPPETVLLWSVAWDGEGNPTPSDGPSSPPERWFYRSIHLGGTIPLPEGHSQNWVYEVDTTTQIELVTGGRPFSTNQQLYVLHIQAADQDTDDPLSEPIATVPSSDITVLGEHPDSNGRVWKVFADNQTVDVTPSATSTHTNYDFTVDATKLKLKILRNGQDIAGKKTVVWVGQPINLSVDVNVPGFVASNFVWTVPGNTISNYVYNYTNGFVLPTYPKTNNSVAFHWVDGLERARVQVEGVIGGKPIKSETTFEVRRPDTTFKLTPKSPVEISTNYGGHEFAGIYPRLQAGRNITTNDVGMFYEFILDDLKGFQDSYEFQFFQIATIDIKVNMPYTGGQYFSKEVQMRGLDNSLPYKSWTSPTTYGYTEDSPGHILISDLNVFVYDHNQFECYLMFKPFGGIPVPLKVTNWEWKGKALFNAANGLWTGLTPFVNPQGSVASDTLTFPNWTNNAANHPLFFNYNSFWFVP